MQEKADNFLLYWLSTVLVIVAAAKYYTGRLFHKRMFNLRQNTPPEVPSQRIIIAIEPDNLLFKFSSTELSGYQEIVLLRTGWSNLWARFLRLLGRGNFYRMKQSRRNILAFLQTLKWNPKVQLFLYTSLPMQLVELILKKQELLSYFPSQYRRSCGDFSCEPAKHPIEVDINTKRVAIITGTKQDHQEEDNKYFLVINKKEISLSKSARYLEKIVNKNKDIDEFHNQLANLKANIESDCEAYA